MCPWYNSFKPSLTFILLLNTISTYAVMLPLSFNFSIPSLTYISLPAAVTPLSKLCASLPWLIVVSLTWFSPTYFDVPFPYLVLLPMLTCSLLTSILLFLIMCFNIWAYAIYSWTLLLLLIGCSYHLNHATDNLWCFFLYFYICPH